MKPSTLNILFLIAGLIGTPLCIYAWHRSPGIPWLIGIGIFAYFLVSSLREVLVNLPQTMIGCEEFLHRALKRSP